MGYGMVIAGAEVNCAEACDVFGVGWRFMRFEVGYYVHLDDFGQRIVG